MDENYQTTLPGTFAAGNVLQVHDLVDFVSQEAERLAHGVLRYMEKGCLPDCPLFIRTTNTISHIIPQKISGTQDVILSLRIRNPMDNLTITLRQNGVVIQQKPMQKALPSEMIQFKLSHQGLSAYDDLEVGAEC